MSMMPPSALADLRRMAQKWMVDEIEIWRPPTAQLEADLTASTVADPAGPLIQTICRISPTRGPRQLPVGEGVMALRDADFLTPHDGPLPWVDDEVRVVTSADPMLQGRWFRITDVRVFSQQATRRFSAVQAQPSRQWRPA